MDYLIGVGLALSVSLLARIAGLDRDRAFYPTVMIVIASYYGLFAIMGGWMSALGMESVAIAAFLSLGTSLRKRSFPPAQSKLAPIPPAGSATIC